LLSPEQIRQIRDNTFDPTPYYPDSSGSESASTEWPLKDHVYTIRNYSVVPDITIGIDHGQLLTMSNGRREKVKYQHSMA
ncbi:MAG: hypothetical protein SPH53_02760, partial [Bacteroidaceae bacterium]|nr:hypothetical protein [Bacteroidaceae bacterium]